MGRQSKLKKLRQADPERAQRIAAMVESERQLRASIERALQMGKELGEHVHYFVSFRQDCVTVEGAHLYSERGGVDALKGTRA